MWSERCCYSATIRPIDIILSSLICEVIMNLTSKSCNFCHYGLREIGQNVKCAIIAPPLGQLIYGEMRHDPRTAGLLLFIFLDLWFMSYRPKRKEHCYSATISLKPSACFFRHPNIRSERWRHWPLLFFLFSEINPLRTGLRPYFVHVRTYYPPSQLQNKVL